MNGLIGYGRYENYPKTWLAKYSARSIDFNNKREEDRAREPTIKYVGPLALKFMENGKSYLAQVHGGIMCKNVPEGKYRLEISAHNGRLTGTFFRPRGKKPIIRHYLIDLMLDETDSDLSRTEIISEIISSKGLIACRE